jgi:hypothetical protein
MELLLLLLQHKLLKKSERLTLWLKLLKIQKKSLEIKEKCQKVDLPKKLLPLKLKLLKVKNKIQKKLLLKKNEEID